MAEISDIVRVSARLGASGAAQEDFGRPFYLYPASDISTILSSITALELEERATELNKVRVFSNQTGVAAAFDSGDDPYDAGAIFFQQEPFPKNLLVGAWYASGADAYVYGGAIGTLTGLSAPELSFAGNALTLGDISGDDADDIAVILAAQIVMITGLTAVSVDVLTVAASSRFIVKIPISDLAAFTSAFAGSSADELGLDSGSAVVYAGLPSESVEDGLWTG